MSSVAQQHRRCMAQYEALLNSTVPASDSSVQGKVAECARNFHQLLDHAVQSGALSRNETIEDMSTSALALQTVPFYLAQLASRRVVDNDGSRRHAGRVAALEVSNTFYRQLFDQCEAVGLLTEEQLEKRLEGPPTDRTSKIKAHQRRRELEAQVAQIDGEIRHARAKTRRMRRILAEEDEELDDAEDGEAARRGKAAAATRDDQQDGEGDHDDDDTDDELLRKRHIAALKLCLEEGFDAFYMSQREIELLGALSDEEKAKAVASYQDRLHEDRSHAPASTIHFPGSSGAPTGLDPDLAKVYLSSRTGISGAMVQQARPGMNYQVLGCGHTQPLRQQIKDQAFTDRNAPTQTLQEFAEQEMAFVQQQMDFQAEGQRLLKEEDERLGVEGREERERYKAAAWDDWKDAHPANGISDKGNFS